MGRRLGVTAAVACALWCAPAAPAREVTAGQAAARGAANGAVRLARGVPESFSLTVRPYRAVAVRIRSSRCRVAPLVTATIGGRPTRLAVERAWAWRTASGTAGPGGRLELSLKLTTRQRACTVLVDTLRVEEHIELGTAMWTRYMGVDPRYEDTADRGFGSVTPENDMKMRFLQPRQGRFDFRAADRLVEWARAHGKTVHGHTLVYGEQLPGWLTRRDLFGRSVFTRGQLLAILETHVKTVVSHFRGRVASWDVVNEAFQRDGSLRPNLFLEVIGPEYIELAFRWARESDPDAKLFYNDAGAELENAMSDALLAEITQLRARAVPIDGIGFQAHLDIGNIPGTGALAANVRRFAEAGLDIAFSELDVSVEARNAPEDRLAAQADAFANVGAACAAEPRCVRVTVWGVGDEVSWRGVDRAPLLFDAGYRAKPAWPALTDALS